MADATDAENLDFGAFFIPKQIAMMEPESAEEFEDPNSIQAIIRRDIAKKRDRRKNKKAKQRSQERSPE